MSCGFELAMCDSYRTCSDVPCLEAMFRELECAGLNYLSKSQLMETMSYQIICECKCVSICQTRLFICVDSYLICVPASCQITGVGVQRRADVCRIVGAGLRGVGRLLEY